MPLEDWMAAIIDYRGKTPEKTSSGIPLITAKIVKGGRIKDTEEFIAEDAYEQWMRRGIPEPGDVVLTTEAPLGEVAQLDGRKVALAQRIITLRGKPGLLDNTYLKFALQSQPIQEQLQGRASGSTVTGIKQSELRKLRLTFPSLKEQQRVAGILGSLDDKIAVNRRINQTLEAMAQAIFKSWFVDFDPVKAKIAAKAEGRDPLRAAMTAISGKPEAELDTLAPDQFAPLAATAALFPDAMEDSELGEIPKGWRSGRLDDLLVLQRGFDLPNQDRTPGKFRVIAASGPLGSHHEAAARGPGVVTGRSGVLGRVFLSLDDYWPLNTTLWVKEFRAATPCYAFELLKGIDFSAFNSGSAVPTLNRNHVHGLPCLVPKADIMSRYEDLALDVQKLIFQTARESDTLMTLRDTLLPRLLSGELQVQHTELEVTA